MITLYNRINPLNVFKSKVKSKSILDFDGELSFGENFSNLEVENKLEKDFYDLKKAIRQKMIEKAIVDEFGKEMPYLAAKVAQKFPLTPNTYGIA
ncbi:MAG: hypothetical protein A2287_05930 [Candidatus Melainabacteria bacterium RIFOXYA12_FULL_32_12]|nr:MAG: hypothetical protein A2255_03045 [Candidatus Melainabacteria bacterium RIFOXYA2_FULL_32_9]OGI30888.1 MAG: hypothetical protein A2287_05930 [Candidatus Melainabacteria bacterium RIFOXYA12_FULL_32_12]